ncbi:MAG: hypothetical protein AAFQ43_06660 [Bacteroidota bacterium]
MVSPPPTPEDDAHDRYRDVAERLRDRVRTRTWIVLYALRKPDPAFETKLRWDEIAAAFADLPGGLRIPIGWPALHDAHHLGRPYASATGDEPLATDWEAVRDALDGARPASGHDLFRSVFEASGDGGLRTAANTLTKWYRRIARRLPSWALERS